MSIEYHLYLLHFFYHVNDYNLFIVFVFMFMGGSMSASMLLLCHLPMTMIFYENIYCIILYVQSHNCISNIYCRSFLYESCVSIKFISSSSYWKTIHSLSNRAPPPTLNTSITFNNKITITPKHIANCFTK